LFPHARNVRCFIWFVPKLRGVLHVSTNALGNGMKKESFENKLKRFVKNLLRDRGELGYAISKKSKKMVNISFGNPTRHFSGAKTPLLDELQVVDIEMMIRLIVARFRLVLRRVLQQPTQYTYEFVIP
jgi:hypothetical protein